MADNRERPPHPGGIPVHREPETNSPKVARQLQELRVRTRELKEIGAGTRAASRLVTSTDGAFIRVRTVKGEIKDTAK